MTSSLFASSIRPKLNGRQRRAAGGFFAVEGTAYAGAPFPPNPIINDPSPTVTSGVWSGFSAGMVGGMINTQDGLWDSACIGYSAKTVPMWPSVLEGRENLCAAIDSYAQRYFATWGVYPPITGTGYSQGSMVWDVCYLYDFLTPPGGTDPNGKPTGRLHYLLPYLFRIYQFGHIFRSPGIAWGNALAGLPQSIMQNGVESGGIGGPNDLTPEQTNRVAPDGKPTIYSCANHGDIYTCSPCGLQPYSVNTLAKQGKTGYLFFKIIMQPTFSDVVEAATVLETPIASIEEGLNAGTFFAEGVNAPHYQYFPQMSACIGDVLALGNSLPNDMGYDLAA